MSLSLRFKISKYDPKYLAPNLVERKPTIMMYFDRDFEREASSVVVDDEDTAGANEYEIVVEGRAKQVPLVSCPKIGVRQLIETNNKTGYTCKTDGGVADLDLREIISCGVGWSKRVETLVLPANGHKKGEFTLTLMECKADGFKLTDSPMIGDSPAQEDLMEECKMYVQSLLKNTMNAIPDNEEQTQRVRMLFYMGPGGMMSTKEIALPSAAFSMVEVPSSNMAFWDNTLDVVMKRRGLTRDMYNDLTVDQKCRLMLGMMVYPAQSFPYEGDHVDLNNRVDTYRPHLKKPIESFDNSGILLSGDCEDGGQDISMVHMAFCQYKFPPEATIHRDLQQISRCYVSSLSLDSVTSAAVGMRSKKIGAHMNDFLLPQEYFKSSVANVNPKIANRLPFSKEALSRTDLPVLTGEGTGVFSVEQGVDPNLAAKRIAYTMPSSSRFKKAMWQESGKPSKFYLSELKFVTPQIASNGSRYVNYVLCDASGRRGYPFQSLEQKSTDLHLVPEPPMPPLMWKYCQEKTKLRAPPLPLKLTTPNDNTNVIKLMNELVQGVQKLGRKATSGGYNSSVPLIMPANDFNASIMYSLLQDIEQRDQIYKVDYDLERIMDQASDNLRINLYVN